VHNQNTSLNEALLTQKKLNIANRPILLALNLEKINALTNSTNYSKTRKKDQYSLVLNNLETHEQLFLTAITMKPGVVLSNWE